MPVAVNTMRRGSRPTGTVATTSRAMGLYKDEGIDLDMSERAVQRVDIGMGHLPGDVILTGTPSGVGPVVPGDRVDISVEGVGTLSNAIEREPRA